MGNELDAALESAVRSLRAASQRAGCPATFKAGDKKELARICELYPRIPLVYKNFLERHDPQDAMFSPSPGNAITLLGLNHVEDGQLGYAVNTGKHKPDDHSGDWRETWLVIGADNDEPFYLECSEAKNGEAPVYHAYKQGGRWHNAPAGTNFEKFLRLTAAYMDGYRSWEDPEADDFQMPDRVRAVIGRSLKVVDPQLDAEAYWLA